MGACTCSQCRDALDDLTYLAPMGRTGSRLSRLNAFPGVRSGFLACVDWLNYQAKWLPIIEQRLHPDDLRGGDGLAMQTFDDTCTTPASAPANGSPRSNTLQRNHMRSPAWTTTSCSTARHLLAIGYNVGERRRDASYYDLLASEARLSSFVAIAQGQLPQESWFALGRLLTTTGGGPILLSWSGSMFEYLMPLLVMPTYEQRCSTRPTGGGGAADRVRPRARRALGHFRVRLQHGRCCTSITSTARSACPASGLKRGLAEDLVIAPYASALALMVAPEEACANLQRLAAEGLRRTNSASTKPSTTRRRGCRADESSVVVRSFMAHHQGMSFLSLAYLLLDRPMQRRFESDPAVSGHHAALLQERIPKAGGVLFRTAPSSRHTRDVPRRPEMPVRVFDIPRHASARGAVAVERPLPRDGHQRGRRLQPLEGPRGHALARGHHVRQLGHVLLPPRRRRAASSGRPRYQPTLKRARTLRSDLLRRARRIPPPRRRASTRTRRSSSRPKTTSSCAGSRITNRSANARTDRGHELCGSRARAAGRGRAASGVQQSVRADGDRPRAAGDLCTRRPRSLDEHRRGCST